MDPILIHCFFDLFMDLLFVYHSQGIYRLLVQIYVFSNCHLSYKCQFLEYHRNSHFLGVLRAFNSNLFAMEINLTLICLVDASQNL